MGFTTAMKKARTSDHDWWKRCKRPARKKSVDPNIRMVGTGITRFSRTAKSIPKGFKGRANGKYSTDLIKLEVVRLRKAGKTMAAIGKALGIPRTTIENWVGQVNLPRKPTSPYTLERMRKAADLALKLYREGKVVKVRECFYVAAIQLDPRVKVASLLVYLSLEAIPCCPGLPLYREQSVQHRCEELYFGRRVRGTDILDEVTLPVAQEPVALQRESSEQVSVPLVRMPIVDLGKFLSCRRKLGLQRLRL